MNSYDMLIAKGFAKGYAEGYAKEKKEGKARRNIFTIQRMLLKKFSINLIADILDMSPKYVQQIQVELKQEKKIRKLLQDKKTPKQIAKQLKVSKILVKAIKNLIIEEKANKQK